MSHVFSDDLFYSRYRLQLARLPPPLVDLATVPVVFYVPPLI